MLWQYMVADRATPTAKTETTMAPVDTSNLHLKDYLIKIAMLLREAASVQLCLRFFGSGGVILIFLQTSVEVNHMCAALSTTNAPKKVVALQTCSIVAISTRWWSSKVVYTRERAGGR